MNKEKLEGVLYFIISLAVFVVLWTAADWLWSKLITGSTFQFNWQKTLGIGVVVCLVATMNRSRHTKKKDLEDK